MVTADIPAHFVEMYILLALLMINEEPDGRGEVTLTTIGQTIRSVFHLTSVTQDTVSLAVRNLHNGGFASTRRFKKDGKQVLVVALTTRGQNQATAHRIALTSIMRVSLAALAG